MYLTGTIKIDKNLEKNHLQYLYKFISTRRVKRDSSLTKNRSEIFRTNVNLPIGIDGEFFVNEEGFMGQNKFANDIIEYNKPPNEQPSIWCPWRIGNEEGREYKGKEENFKASNVIWNNDDMPEHNITALDWLNYLIINFFKPWGYTLNGEIEIFDNINYVEPEIISISCYNNEVHEE